MGEPIHCFSLRNGGCALSVQKINFYFTGAKTIVYSCQTRYWQGFGNMTVKCIPSKGFIPSEICIF